MPVKEKAAALGMDAFVSQNALFGLNGKPVGLQSRIIVKPGHESSHLLSFFDEDYNLIPMNCHAAHGLLFTSEIPSLAGTINGRDFVVVSSHSQWILGYRANGNR